MVSGTDAVSGFPVDRGWDCWPARVMAATAQGGLSSTTRVSSIRGSSGSVPREALAMDPAAAVAAGDLLGGAGAGRDPAAVAARAARPACSPAGPRPGMAWGWKAAVRRAFLLTGTAGAVLSGRVSYVLGLEGVRR
ncbi:hypothetical protein [Thermocatellispora tengchongensis]|uniref:hypothetical protein n=1 Tax=Thermocatellispora tengchongensis TaxID=1073253 RepID=UPI00362573F1